MTLIAYLPRDREPDAFDALQESLSEDVEVVIGTAPPERFHVLIAGRPDPAHLTASDELEALVIPFAGLPASTRETLARFPNLRVHNLHHNAEATAEMALALLLGVAKQLVPFDRAFREHDWRPRYAEFGASVLLHRKRALVLGFGAIGRHIAQVLSALGMDVGATCRTPADHPEADAMGVSLHTTDSLAELLPQTDVLMVALPLTDETEGLIGAPELELLPTGAILVNVGRGPVVEAKALYEALAAKRLQGAGLDVWYRYPDPDDRATRAHTPPSDFPFNRLDNVVMSPHRAGGGDSIERRRMQQLAELLNALARGETDRNRVDPTAGY